MFAAIDAGDSVGATAIDEREVDPTFNRIETQVFAAANASRATATRELDTLARIQSRVMTMAPVIIVCGISLAVFFWMILRRYEHGAEEAMLRETIATHQRERRYRSLAQNTSDVILTCGATGSITYQSPAAETAWGYGAAELLNQNLMTLVHVEDLPAFTALFERVRADRGPPSACEATATELQLRDGAGQWRWVQMIMRDLLNDSAVRGVVVTIRDIEERKAFEQQLTHQAFYNSLTGLPNRLLFRDRLHQALVRASRQETRVGLLLLDLDNFKLINDSLGHLVGDELLIKAAARLEACVRAEDTVARLGGDEFVIVLEQLTSESDALPVAEAITTQFGRKFSLAGHDVIVTVSIGIALDDAGLDQVNNLLRNADVAMYRAKSDGKGRYAIFDAGMHMASLAQLELESDLRRALAEGELRVYYQGIVAMDPGHIDEVEALVRWQHPVRGLVAPSDFIGVAEETGLIVQLGQWVLEEACRQVVGWHVQFPADPPLMLSVNLSPRQFQVPDLVEEVARALRETGLPANCLKLEITEGVIMRDIEATILKLRRLKRLGIRIAVDDFGTGHSSLSYLKRLPVDVLKIDQSFVSGLGRNQEDIAIVRAIISLAKSLDLTVTGEGIETQYQADLLGAWGCDLGQGYYYGKPVDDAAMTAILRKAGHGGHGVLEQTASAAPT